jgi:rhodanese-related sulfurtransferase
MTTMTATSAPTASTGRASHGIVTPQEADALHRTGRAVIVDVREPDEIRRTSVATYIPVPSSVARADCFPPAVEGVRMLILCQSGNRAGQVARTLAAAGRADVSVIEGGIRGWQAAGLPVTSGGGSIPIIRQVLIVAGSMVAAFTALGVFVNPWFLAGAGFVGCGLAFAGLTGICPMAKVLGAMPWNAPKAAPAGAPAAAAAGKSCSASGSCGCG